MPSAHEHRHPLLRRQLEQTLGAGAMPDEALAALLALVDQAYHEADAGRADSERSLRVLTAELTRKNERLALQLDAVRRQAEVLENIHDAVLVLGPEGRIRQANEAAARLLDQADGALVTRGVSDLFRLPNGASADLTHLAADHRWSGELSFTRGDGTTLVLEATVVPRKDDTPEIQGWIAVMVDITARRQMERQSFLSQKLEAIGQLAAGIAHEINTPAQYVADNLRFLEDMFQQLMEHLDPAEAQTEFMRAEVPAAIQQSLDGMERIAEIVRGVKTFAHPGTGERRSVDLNAILESVIAVTRNEWKYVADVETDLDPDLPLVPAFPGDIDHVFLNIIVNAAHAIGDAHPDDPNHKGRIVVSSRADGEWVEVRIRDDGPGIPESIRSRVFDPFFTTKPVGKGTGQGLAISIRAVHEQHGGHLRFETAPGQGTTFIIRLPLETASGAAPPLAA